VASFLTRSVAGDVDVITVAT